MFAVSSNIDRLISSSSSSLPLSLCQKRVWITARSVTCCSLFQASYTCKITVAPRLISARTYARREQILVHKFVRVFRLACFPLVCHAGKGSINHAALWIHIRVTRLIFNNRSRAVVRSSATSLLDDNSSEIIPSSCCF